MPIYIFQMTLRIDTGFIKLGFQTHNYRGVPTEGWKPVDEPNRVIITMHRTVGTPFLCDIRLSMG